MAPHLKLLALAATASACSNILVTPGAAADGNSMISYNADEASLIGAIAHWPAGKGLNGTTREVFSWDLGIKLGEVPNPDEVLNVMGNANEKGVIIGETTHGGLTALSNVGKTAANGTIIDYGNLIWLTLQRAHTASEAVDIMVELATTYGYASDMEGFSIADKDEVWYMELLGRGDYGEGVLYVALKIPDGYMMAHANQARITEFLPCDDPATCRCSPDVVEFAQKHGFYDGEKADFSFSGVYDPVTFEGCRFCEARVWYVFREAADFDASKYLDYAKGYDTKNRMPLWVKPKAKLTRDDVMKLMGSHYEGSWFDPAVDVGAGPEHTPYRWNGLTWDFQNATYVNERPVGTQYTGWHFIGQVRGALPPPLQAVLWFGADDHSYSPKIPIHGGANGAHESYDDADCHSRSACRREAGLPGTVTDLSLDNAWWLNNMVADQVYTRYDRAAPVVLAKRADLEAELATMLNDADAAAAEAFAAGDREGCHDILTKHAIAAGQKATETWRALWAELLVTFIDGRITVRNDDDHICGCSKDTATFTDAWKTKVVADTGDKYLEPENAKGLAASAGGGRPKLSIRGVVA